MKATRPAHARALLLAALLLAASPYARAQDTPLYQSDFPAAELQARRQKVLDAIGKNAIAIVQGAPSVRGFEVFRQSNEFYYLTGLEVPHSYVLLDGRSGKTTLYLPHRDAERERNEGRQLAAEDAEEVQPRGPGVRLIKSPREIALLRRAAQLAGQGLVEAMRSTRPGVFEYQLDAAARYIFYVNGARGEAYSSITAAGQNAWFGHYFHNKSRLQDGQMVLMDFAPDYRYYTSDVGRMWPVSGRYKEQLEKPGP